MVSDDLNNDVLAAQVVGMRGFWCAPGSSGRRRWTVGPQTNSRCSPTTSSTRVADLPGLLEF